MDIEAETENNVNGVRRVPTFKPTVPSALTACQLLNLPVILLFFTGACLPHLAPHKHTCYLLSSPVRRLGIEAGLEHVGHLWVTAVSVVVVVLNTVALHVAHAILPFPGVTGPLSEAVPPIVARSGVVTLWVTSAVPDLLNLAVAENKLLPEAGVFLVVHLEIKGDVVWAKGLGEGAVLEPDLAFRHGGISTVILAKVDNSIANALEGAQLPVLVVAGDDVGVITEGQAAGRGQVWGHNLWFGDRGGDNSWVESSFVWSPNLFHLGQIQSRGTTSADQPENLLL